jgi:T1SS-143 domain-containing protein
MARRSDQPGEAITYSQSGDVLTATAGTREVFTVEVNPDGTFTFTLKDSLDHENADGENVENLGFTLTGAPNAAVLTAAVDGDGDPVDGLADASVTQTFAVDVTDDVPVATNNQALSGRRMPDRLTRTTCRRHGPGEGRACRRAAIWVWPGGRDLITIDYGADGAATGAPSALEYSDLDWAITGPAGLTSNGDAVTYSYDAGTDTLTATPGAVTVFTVTANSDGTYTFDARGPIDHVDANGENVETLSFSMVGSPSQSVVDAVRDFDQDAADGLETETITQNFAVNVVDDVPVAAEAHTENAAVVAASVDEDDLTDGTDGTDPTSVSGSIGFDAGDLITIDYGADGPAAGAPTGLGHGDLDFVITGPCGSDEPG